MKKIFSAMKRIWMLFAQKLGKINSILLLSIVYFVIIGIMSLVVRILRKDLLHKKIDPVRTSYWQNRPSSEPTLERHKFQF
ncbi:MAG: hypothetical protein EHM64_10875 [Ignavibacteriae bacterium]|nr:MAG: hypothetical protein EHM64_10875 [Ignavibacteriota bacterium]